MQFSRIPHFLPQLNAKEKAIRIAYKGLGYCRRVSRKKGFSDDPRIMEERLIFAEDGKIWARERVQRVAFTNEVWAFGGAHTSGYVTVLEDRSNRLLPEVV